MSSKTFKGLTALAVSTSILAISTPAFAQLDEIIVTATKTEKSLQDVSASIAAFDVEALERNRIEGLEDIAQSFQVCIHSPQRRTLMAFASAFAVLAHLTRNWVWIVKSRFILMAFTSGKSSA